MFNKDKKEEDNAKMANVDEHGLSMMKLEKSDYGALMKSPSEVAGIIRANVGPSGINMGNLTRVKMPSGESMMWQVPSIRGLQAVEQIEGIIIHHTDGRAYWKRGIDEAGGAKKQPPDCASEDLFTGRGDPGGACAECKLNVWGSNPKSKRGKACKEVKVLYVLPKGRAFLPFVFILPPTSLKPIKNYLLGLASEALRVDQVTTILGLSKATNSEGVEHAVVEPEMPKKGGELTDEEIVIVAAYVAAIKPALERRVEFEQTDAEGDVSEEE